MQLSSGGLKLVRRVVRNAELPIAELPAFLCPGIIRSLHFSRLPLPPAQKHVQSQRRFLHLSESHKPDISHEAPPAKSAKLPLQCAGCGALSQTQFDQEPGFYSLSRKSVKEYLEGPSSHSKVDSAEDEVLNASLRNANPEILKSLGLEKPSLQSQPKEPPICDRCHVLKHHHTGISIYHPSVQSLQQTISESPYKYNHIYHIIDAADFPMSFIPGIHKLLHLTPQRSLNRRAKTGRFYHDRKTEISFIITRSDLFAPLKTQVDSMMPYLTTVLRDALGRSGKDVRLGNVRCVSAIRGWWTPTLKEEIFKRGGGGWMVGKVNVGKSQLFHDVFPKGRGKQGVLEKPPPTLSSPEVLSEEERISELRNKLAEDNIIDKELEQLDRDLDTKSLLPPAQVETSYPAMPLVSALPGTTASPIRVPFGNGKGELIDLPGISRGDLELFVQEEQRSSLVMRSRIRPEQEVLKPGQSLLLGGFIRITPLTPDVIILAYAFTPIKAHKTSTEKAIGTQTQTRESGVENIALPGVGEKIASAGTFPLKWDVTKQRTGPITASDAGKIKVEQLPFKVLSTDILIEGCGWVELVAQVRKRYNEPSRINEEWDSPSESQKESNLPSWDEAVEKDEEKIDPSWPIVEVFTPEGKFIAQRRPMNAWLHVASKPSVATKGRPRKSMKGMKKKMKVAARRG